MLGTTRRTAIDDSKQEGVSVSQECYDTPTAARTFDTRFSPGRGRQSLLSRRDRIPDRMRGRVRHPAARRGVQTINS